MYLVYLSRHQELTLSIRGDILLYSFPKTNIMELTITISVGIRNRLTSSIFRTENNYAIYHLYSYNTLTLIIQRQSLRRDCGAVE